MNNPEASEYSKKSSDINNLLTSLLSLEKKSFNYFLNKLFAVALCIILMGLVVSIVRAEGEATDYSYSEQPTPFDYLKQRKGLPVDFLLSVFYTMPELQKKNPAHKIPHPFFESLEHVSLIRRPLQHAAESLSHLLSHSEIDKYIEQNLLIPVTNIPVFHWLLTRYASIQYRDNNKIHLLTVTIGGMLYDLQQRKENGDAVAARVLDALKRPYMKPPTNPGDNQSFLFKWPKVLRQLFLPAKDSTFSDWMMQTDLPYTDQQSRYQCLSALKQKGYQYKKDYTFISHETDKDGNIAPVSSNDIFQTEAEVQKALAANYSDLPDETSVAEDITGMKFAGKTANKIGALAFSGMFFLSMINSGVTSPIPPRCETEGNCGSQNYQPLFNHNFTMDLKQNSTGHFKLAENITLNTQGLPTFPNCSQPFSGILNTGNYTIHAENGTSPLFGCVDQAHIAGNINPCSAGTLHTQPVIANQLLNESVINIKQTGECKRQLPLLDDISGSNNQIAFTGASGSIIVASDSGIVANSVSGDSNMITAEGGHLLDAPVVSVSGGNGNTYRQKNINITRSEGNYRFDNKFLLADHFSGNETTIIQNGINVAFSTTTVPDFNIQNRNISDTPNRTVTTLSSDTVIKEYTSEESVRLTNISDNSGQRSVVTNNGRVEVYKNGEWIPFCENALSIKTADVVCRSMGYKKAEPEGRRLLLRNALSTRYGYIAVTYAKECTGNEQHLQQCKTANIVDGECSPGRAAFLSCSNEITTENTRLTDFNTDSVSRFDTTDTGRGRLEQKNFLEGELHTICATGFNNQSANVACESMGYPGGSIDSTQVTPLPESIPILTFNWNCAGNETSLLQCPYQNITTHNCTHNHDVVLRCNSNFASANGTRLTDRNSNDDYRAVTTKTGLGRFEGYYPETDSFMPFCILDLGTIDNVCRNFGFSNGEPVHFLTAKPLPLPGYNNSYLPRIYCAYPGRCQIDDTHGSISHCPINHHTVILCHDGSTVRPQVQAKTCVQSNQQSGKTILFSGRFNPPKMNCELNQCPLKYWDADGVKNSDFLNRQCSEQRLHTTIPEDWMKVWNGLCQNKQYNCNCHLPNEQVLGLVSQNSALNETWLVSRQNYHDNNHANERGLILIRELSSGGSPQVLQAANETLVTTLPVNQVITENYFTEEKYLLGLYSNAKKNGSIQLFWSSLDPGNNEYYALTIPVNGEPLLLTENSIFVKNSQNRTIMQHEINAQIHHLNTVDFNINRSPEIIHFPNGIINIYTAAVKDKWLYVAGDDDTDTNQVNVMRYNIITRSWDFGWKKAYSFNQNARMFIDNYNRLQFLSPDQIALTSASVLLPDGGGCVSFSDEVIEIAVPSEITSTPTVMSTISEEKTTVPTTEIKPIPTMTPEPEITDGKQKGNNAGLIGGIFAAACAVPITVACCACYFCKKHCGCKNKKKKHVYSDPEWHSESIEESGNN